MQNKSYPAERGLCLSPFPKISVSFLFLHDYLDRVELALNEEGFLCFFNTLYHENDPQKQQCKSFDTIKQQLMAWLKEYLKGQAKPQTCLLNIPISSSFTQKVWKALTSIPFGHTLSYKELASRAGSDKAARAVGNACNKNPFPLLLPCHRVIAAYGKLGGFAKDVAIKQRLLAFEKKLNSKLYAKNYNLW